MTADMITAIKKALEGVTPGPWQVLTKEHDWAFPETAHSPASKGKHVERRIFTTWVHPQLKAEWGVVDLALAVDVSGKMSLYIVGLSEKDADYIAAVNPAAISDLLSTLESLQRENEESKARIEKLEQTLKAVTGNKIGFTYEPTGERVNLYSPDPSAFAIIAQHPEILQAIVGARADIERHAALSSTGDTHGN